MLSGQVVSRTQRYKWMCVAGFAIATSGMFLLSTMDAGSSQWLGMTGMAVLGFGLGLSFTPLVLAAQNAVPYQFMGVTTSLNQFSRSVGGTIGVAILGSWLTRRLNDELSAGLPAEVQSRAPAPLLEQLGNPRLLLDGDRLTEIRERAFAPVFGDDAAALFDATVESMQRGLATSITEVFLVASVLMAVSILLAVFLKEIPMHAVHPAVEGAEDEDDGTVRSWTAAGS
jgi:hypothetical protein